MVNLNVVNPCDGLLPIEAGACQLRAVEHKSMTLVSAYKGKEQPLSAALNAAYGIGFPKPNRAAAKAGVRAVWFGYDQALLIGAGPDAALAEFAALVDQSDSWAVVRLQGEQAVDVLARLTSLDLRPAVFKRGHTARSELRHMMVSITRVGADAFEIMAFRSMAKTLVDELRAAMLSVAAQ
ncbi:sarcosine oxidase subunit gamma [Marinosulfonomonas sp. PRT-SC04]|nr:sarcosine oxidase subunit gamma [Marinosulfonomonas sp. PRT-SC04]